MEASALAKMTGITPLMFTLMGMCVLAAVHLAADNALCVLDRDATFGSVQDHDEHNHCNGQNNKHRVRK